MNSVHYRIMKPNISDSLDAFSFAKTYASLFAVVADASTFAAKPSCFGTA
jgi:hypothetical protein